MTTSWDHELTSLLTELSAVQGEVLGFLQQKRERLLASDMQALAEGQRHEEELIARLQACHDRRAALLAKAAEEGLPGNNLRSLAQSLPKSQRDRLHAPLRDTSARARLLQHQSLTNWVVVQRTLLHLAQLLEIIATGGRPQPTYGQGTTRMQSAGGALVDQAA